VLIFLWRARRRVRRLARRADDGLLAALEADVDQPWADLIRETEKVAIREARGHRS
jgi:hypothetical protein